MSKPSNTTSGRTNYTGSSTLRDKYSVNTSSNTYGANTSSNNYGNTSSYGGTGTYSGNGNTSSYGAYNNQGYYGGIPSAYGVNTPYNTSNPFKEDTEEVRLLKDELSKAKETIENQELKLKEYEDFVTLIKQKAPQPQKQVEKKEVIPQKLTLDNVKTVPGTPTVDERVVVYIPINQLKYNIDVIKISIESKEVEIDNNNILSADPSFTFTPQKEGTYTFELKSGKHIVIQGSLKVSKKRIPVVLHSTDQISQDLFNEFSRYFQKIDDFQVVQTGGVPMIVSSAITERVEQYFDNSFDYKFAIPVVIQRTSGDSMPPPIIDPWGNLIVFKFNQNDRSFTNINRTMVQMCTIVGNFFKRKILN